MVGQGSRGTAVFVRGVAAWIALVGLADIFLALVWIDAGRSLPEVIRLPWSLTPRQLLLGGLAMGILALVTAAQLWRLVPSGRALGVVFLGIVSIWAAIEVYESPDAMSGIFAALNAWLAAQLLRRDAVRACSGSRHA